MINMVIATLDLLRRGKIAIATFATIIATLIVSILIAIAIVYEQHSPISLIREIQTTIEPIIIATNSTMITTMFTTILSFIGIIMLQPLHAFSCKSVLVQMASWGKICIFSLES